MSKHYVVYCLEHLRDGIEEGSKIVASLEAAEEVLDKWANGFAGSNCEFKLFELGPEVPIGKGVVETPQPSIKKTKFRTRTSE